MALDTIKTGGSSEQPKSSYESWLEQCKTAWDVVEINDPNRRMKVYEMGRVGDEALHPWIGMNQEGEIVPKLLMTDKDTGEPRKLYFTRGRPGDTLNEASWDREKRIWRVIPD